MLRWSPCQPQKESAIERLAGPQLFHFWYSWRTPESRTLAGIGVGSMVGVGVSVGVEVGPGVGVSVAVRRQRSESCLHHGLQRGVGGEDGLLGRARGRT